MFLRQFYLTFSCITTLFFLGLLYLYFSNKRAKDFLYASLLFLSGSLVLFSMFHLELRPSSHAVIFWSKLLYASIFSYIYTLPHFTLSITKEKINRGIQIGLNLLSILFILLTFSTDFIIKNRVIYKTGIKQAELSNVYPYLILIVLAIIVYFYIHILNAARKKLNKKVYYLPLIIGMGIGIASGIIDFLGITAGKPLITDIPNPFIFGIFITSLSFGWTFLSQYTWAFTNLTKSQEEIEKLVEKSNRDFLEFVHLIAKTLEAKDHYTAGHSLRVMDYATKIAQALNLPDKEIELLKQACLLHDIGKISIPDGILNKKKNLTKKEREHILKHPIIGKNILSTVSEFKEILDIIYAHHERVDGKGYPDGKTKDEIPLLARILAVADTYDAMRSERPYRRAKSKKQALKELQLARGSQLDEEVVDIFIKALSTA